ncbi:hypothetical protein MPDQ_006273 [Monascus purpureus]|uniref:Uncharacterized protein n=1 Tax=Monascus purpureus TaxID=5098 RepID=A0A507QYP3_MONPU|nr:hypothetical protein MPDQ_006273 [Monascus purpureus]BDD63928.1 hypothetical protein MAP00_008783 [Monascus purpureus]
MDPLISKGCRSLNTEILMLRREIEEWEDKFEARVSEEVAWRTEIESDLKAKIVFLEDQLEGYACRIKELERARELQAQKLRRAESLRSTNRNLERRIDVLTQLLAQPLAKPDRRSPPLSPMRSPGPRLSRPKSMLLSPPLRTESLPRAADNFAETGREITASNFVPDDSAMTSSSMSSKSQWSSVSRLSSASSQWSMPLPLPFESQGRKPARHVSMRTFASGTCALKPLILPSAARPHPEYGRGQLSPHDDHHSHSFTPNPDGGFLDGAGNYGACRTREDTLAGRPRRYRKYSETIVESRDNLSDALPFERSTGRSRYSQMLQTSGISNNRSSFTLFSPVEETAGLGIHPESQRGQKYHSSRTTSDPRIQVEPDRLSFYARRSNNYRPSKAHGRTYSLSRSHRAANQKPKLDICRARQGLLQRPKTAIYKTAGRVVANICRVSITRFQNFSWSLLRVLLGPQYLDEWQRTSLLTTRSLSLAAALVVTTLDTSPWSRPMGFVETTTRSFPSLRGSSPLATIYSCGRNAMAS